MFILVYQNMFIILTLKGDFDISENKHNLELRKSRNSHSQIAHLHNEDCFNFVAVTTFCNRKRFNFILH
jgi:hypothetical protein